MVWRVDILSRVGGVVSKRGVGGDVAAPVLHISPPSSHDHEIKLMGGLSEEHLFSRFAPCVGTDNITHHFAYDYRPAVLINLTTTMCLGRFLKQGEMERRQGNRKI